MFTVGMLGVIFFPVLIILIILGGSAFLSAFLFWMTTWHWSVMAISWLVFGILGWFMEDCFICKKGKITKALFFAIFGLFSFFRSCDHRILPHYHYIK